MRRSTVQNGRQIDLSTQVERVKRKTRPWKSIIALLLAIAAAVISHLARRGTFTTNDLANQFIGYGAAVAFLVFGSSAVFGLAGKSRELLSPTAGPAHAAIVRYAILIVGAFTMVIGVFISATTGYALLLQKNTRFVSGDLAAYNDQKGLFKGGLILSVAFGYAF